MKTKEKRKSRRPASVSDFAQQLERELPRLAIKLDSPTTVVVAVSGGADSTALLLALDELVKAKLLSWTIVVAHLDHRLRASSKEDARWVTELAHRLKHDAITKTANVRLRAKNKADNLEQAARHARYEFLLKLAKQKQASIVLTAHTLDDQAETVLLRLLRGGAAEGLAGIEPVRPMERDSQVLLVRPLVTWCRRRDTEAFCSAHRIEFRRDAMNDDESFARVKVRKQLLPLLLSFNPKFVETVGRSATLLREDANLLSSLAQELLERAAGGKGKDPTRGRTGSKRRSAKTLVADNDVSRTKTPPVNVKVLAAAPPAIRRRALRQWLLESVGSLRRLEMVHLLALERLVEVNGGRTIELPNGIRVRRQRDWLYLSVKTVEKGDVDL
jgi:tRNA(Ile)-lysidine synthase